MKVAVCWAFMAAFAEIITALSLPQRRDGLKVIGVETQRVKTPRNPLQRDKLRRRGALEVGLDNKETLYFINATVGTPAKPLRLHIDTGSSDLWVNTPNSTFCTKNTNPCNYSGTYTANASSTYQYIASNFNITYVDGTGASGDYVSDTVSFGSQKIDRLQFGIGYSSSSSQGVLGIGYQTNEVQVSRAKLSAYKNLPAQLVADGAIQSNAYSIWLNDLDANTGNVLFGGVDSEKYVPPLMSLPVETATGRYAEFMVTLTRLQLNNQTLNGGNDLALAVLLDTGSSLTYLPDSIVQEIYSSLGAVFDSSSSAAYVPCSIARTAPTTRLNFTFSEPTISVGINELVLDLVTSSGRRPRFTNGDAACMFGIAPAGSGTNVLGDTFLRSAYVVYDLENNVIALAQTRFNASASKVVEIGKGAGSIPGATAVQNPVKATEGLRGVHVSAGVRLMGGEGWRFWGRGRGGLGGVGVWVAVGVGAFVGL